MSNKKDFATSTVLTAPSTPTAGTSLVVQSGHGARFPAAPFYVTVHPPSEFPTLDNAEKLLVTAKSTDTFTITRAQGDTTAKSIEAGWRISNAVFLADFPATFDDLTDGTTNKAYTSTEKTKLSGISTGANVTATALAPAIFAATAKATPVDADTVGITDSAASNGLKKVTWANIKATLKTYFDTLYQPLDATLTALAGLATGANKIPYSTGTDTFGQLDLSTSTSLGTSNTTLSSQGAIKSYIDAKITGLLKHLGAQFYNNGGGVLSTAYTTFATVTATSAGGKILLLGVSQFRDGNSGANRKVDMRIQCDGVTITNSGITVPSFANAWESEGVIHISHTPSAGSHTWTLQVAAQTGSATLGFQSSLQVDEVMA